MKKINHSIHQHRLPRRKVNTILSLVAVVLFASSFIIFAYANAYANPPQPERLMDPQVYKINQAMFVK